MKKITFYSGIVLLFLIAATTFSCKKTFLEITPKGRVIAETTNDYQLLLNSFDLTQLGADAPAAMGDEIAAIDPHFTSAALRTQRLFRWEDVIYEANQNANELTVPMTNLYLFNKVINEVMNSTGGTEEEKKSIQAQAMTGRAWVYFLLINYYGKPYNVSTSTNDPGFPIITAADVTQETFVRASVKEVYDFILNDLKSAIPNLPVQLTHRLRICKSAGEGILGKVYTFMGSYSEALTQLNSSIADFSGASIPVGIYDYNVTFAPGGSFLPMSAFGPNYPPLQENQENVLARQYTNFWAFVNNEFVIKPETVALYDTSDLRLKFYSTMPFPAGAAYPAKMLRRISPTLTNFGVMVPDLYLLRAECKGRLNDLTGAKNDVEFLRVRRMPAAKAAVPATIATNQIALVKYILDERIREFAMLGFRWFDMRRLSVDPAYSSTVGNTHNLYSASGTVSTSFTLKPERLVLRFPQKLMDQNPGMENNP